MTDAERDLLFGMAEMLMSRACPGGDIQQRFNRLIDAARLDHVRSFIQSSERYVDTAGASITLSSLPDTPG